MACQLCLLLFGIACAVSAACIRIMIHFIVLEESAFSFANVIIQKANYLPFYIIYFTTIALLICSNLIRFLQIQTAFLHHKLRWLLITPYLLLCVIFIAADIVTFISSDFVQWIVDANIHHIALCVMFVDGVLFQLVHLLLSFEIIRENEQSACQAIIKCKILYLCVLHFWNAVAVVIYFVLIEDRIFIASSSVILTNAYFLGFALFFVEDVISISNAKDPDTDQEDEMPNFNRIESGMVQYQYEA